MPPRQLLVVICDVGPSYGVGHLMRCTALAEEFATRGFEVLFVGDVTSVPFAQRQLESRGFRHRPDPGAVAATLALVEELEPAVVVVDSYHQPPELYRELRRRHRTLAMVDGRPAGQEADVVLDQNIGAEHDAWDYGSSGQVLAGLDHALMRDAIRALRPRSAERVEAEPLRVLAFFGGTDAARVAARVARELVGTGLPFTLTVVSPHPWPGDIRPVAGQEVQVIAPTDDLPALVRDADVVLAAAGTSTWELLCLGAAVGLVCVADNQEQSYDRTVAAGLALGLGHARDLESTAGPVLRRLLTEPDLRARLRRAGFAAVDGDGRRRVVDAVLGGSAAARA